MPDLLVLPYPILTLTENDQGLYRVLIDGEVSCGPYAFRESAESVLEHLSGLRHPELRP